MLSYPDVYEIGISNPALQILYTYLNDATAAAAERAYCPWPDMAAEMRASGVPLWTLETMSPVAGCDLWGFTLPHELAFTNVLEMLDLAGVPLHAAERGDGDPIVLGGGPAVADPWPVAAFFDVFFVGEVEERLDAIVAALAAPTRGQRLAALADIPGMWAPGLSTRPAVRQVFMGFSTAPPVTRPVVPVLEAVHDRAVVEVMRGCSAGCRFCQAGMWYRPVRERSVDLVVETARRLLDETGCDEVSLLSLSSCDYSGIEAALTRIRGLRPGTRVSLPSLRIDGAASSLARFAAEQRGSLTLAPEAGTQRLRDAINKGVDEEQFEDAVRATFTGGFTGLKLYFMIGLPDETDDDVVGIAKMVETAQSLAQGDRPRPRAALDLRLLVHPQAAHALRTGALRRGRDAAPATAAAAHGDAAQRARGLPRRRRLARGSEPGAGRSRQRPARGGGVAAGRPFRRLERALRPRRLAGRGGRARRRVGRAGLPRGRPARLGGRRRRAPDAGLLRGRAGAQPTW